MPTVTETARAQAHATALSSAARRGPSGTYLRPQFTPYEARYASKQTMQPFGRAVGASRGAPPAQAGVPGALNAFAFEERNTVIGIRAPRSDHARWEYRNVSEELDAARAQTCCPRRPQAGSGASFGAHHT